MYRLCLLLLAFLALPLHATEPAVPWVNPHLADSAYPINFGGRGNLTTVAGPVGPSRRLVNAGDVDWSPVGPITGVLPLLSSPYPGDRRVIWVGGYDRVAKLDAKTFEVLATYAKGGTYLDANEIDRFNAEMDRLRKKGDLQAYLNFAQKAWGEPFKSAESVYRMLGRNNEFYLSSRSADGRIALQVYGDKDASDPASPIVLKREWLAPPEISRSKVMSMNMVSDGTVVIATMDGVLVALPQDLSRYVVARLPRKGEENEKNNKDFFSAFLRNGMTVDDHGGIYAVTRDYLQRVQWTGTELSLDAKDGAWVSAYPNNSVIGSGTTPELMGWGSHEDHLVAITDGTAPVNQFMLFWRDAIPDDWKGLPGYDRRVAGVAPVSFGVTSPEQVRIENTPVVWGYGAFLDTALLEHGLPDQGGPSKQWVAETNVINWPGRGAKGGAMMRWDSKTRTLAQTWRTQGNFAITVCTVSSATGLLYCWGARDGDWTLEGIEWQSGKSAFHYALGPSNRFSAFGGPVFLDNDGNVICGCNGGFGIVRVRREAAAQRHR